MNAFCVDSQGAESLAAHDWLSVRTGHPEVDFLHVSRLAGAGWEDVLRSGNQWIRIAVEMTIRRSKRTVDCTVTEPQIPRFFGIPVFALNEFVRPVRVVIGGVAFGEFRLASISFNQLVSVISSRILGITGTVPDLLIIPVSPGPCIGASVPLANLGGGITLLTKDLRPEGALFRIVTTPGIFPGHFHRLDPVRMMTRQQRGPEGIHHVPM